MAVVPIEHECVINVVIIVVSNEVAAGKPGPLNSGLGSEVAMPIPRPVCFMIMPYGRKPTHVSEYVEAAGIVKQGRIGAADILMVPSLQLSEIIFDKLYDEPDFLLCRRDDCVFCRESREAVHKETDSIRGRFTLLREKRVYQGTRGQAA